MCCVRACVLCILNGVVVVEKTRNARARELGKQTEHIGQMDWVFIKRLKRRHRQGLHRALLLVSPGGSQVDCVLVCEQIITSRRVAPDEPVGRGSAVCLSRNLKHNISRQGAQ